MKKLDILYKDKNFIAINKEAGLLSIATDKDKYHNLYREVSEFTKKENKHSKVFIVNRLDKDTSGIVLFSKDESLKRKLQDNWNDIATRKYIAIVKGKTKKEGVIENHLKEDKNYLVKESRDGKLAITKYKLLLYKNGYSLLDIEIKTGRKNQIRYALSSIGHPIIGDKKFSSKVNPISRLGLHAYYLKVNDLEIRSKVPKEFLKMFDVLESDLWKEYKR